MAVKPIKKTAQASSLMQGDLVVSTPYPKYVTNLCSGEVLTLEGDETWKVPKDEKIRTQVIGLITQGVLQVEGGGEVKKVSPDAQRTNVPPE
jgi:peroxiredoxin